jgi:hypothetical protein
MKKRKIIGNMKFINEKNEKNMMKVEKLEDIWGKKIMNVEGEELVWGKLESGVVSDLILLFSQIFEVDAAEL